MAQQYTVVTLLISAALVHYAHAQLIPSFLGWGSCTTAAPQKNFDAQKFAGRWFTLERVPNQYVKTASCVYANYTATADGGFNVKEHGKDSSGVNIQLLSALKNNGEEKPFTVHADDVPEAPLKIMATDYRTYACLQSCMQYVAFKAEFAWILTKKPSASSEAVKKCKEVMKSMMNFDNSQFNKVAQGRGCLYT